MKMNKILWYIAIHMYISQYWKSFFNLNNRHYDLLPSAMCQAIYFFPLGRIKSVCRSLSVETSTLFTCYSSMHLCPILELNGHCFMAKFHQKSEKWNKTNHAFKKYWQWFMYCLLNLSVNTLQRSIYQRRRVSVNKFILLYKSASMDRYHRQVPILLQRGIRYVKKSDFRIVKLWLPKYQIHENKLKSR